MDERAVVFSELAEEIISNGAYKVTKYLGTDLTVKATRKRYGGKVLTGKRRAIEILFTVGPPNYEEREKIKRAKIAGTGPIEMTAKYVSLKK